MKIGASAFLISFVGSIAPGILTLTAVTILISEGLQAALLFTLGATLIEAIAIYLASVASDKIKLPEKYFLLLRLIVLSFVIYMMTTLFKVKAASGILHEQSPILWLGKGMLMSLLNPFHFPFWTGVLVLLKTKSISIKKRNEKFQFVLFASAGTISAFTLYLFFGKHLDGSNEQITNTFKLSLFVLYCIPGYKSAKDIYSVLRATKQ